MLMEFLQLKYFFNAAQTENFSKTANTFSVPASAISQSIQRLENELGTALFERRKNRVILNEEGKIFYQAVRQMNSILSDVNKQLADSSRNSCSEIRMQIFCNRRIISDAIQQFSRTFPEVSFVLNHGFESNKDFDLIISSDDSLKDHFTHLPLLTEQIAMIFPKDHPLALRQSVKIADLSQERFVTMHQGSNLYLLTQQLCIKSGFAPKISIQSDDPFYMRKYIEMGLGIGFAPMFSWKGQFSDALVRKPLEGVTRTTYVFWDPNRYLTKTVSRFLDMLIEFCKQ